MVYDVRWIKKMTKILFNSNKCEIINTIITTILKIFTERDAFDTLFDHAPDKLNFVKKVVVMKLIIVLFNYYKFNYN